MLKALACVAMSGVLLASSSAVSAGRGGPPAPPACTDGKNRRVKMVNDTGTTITELYGSNVSRDKWEEDVLGDSVIKAGGTMTVNWDDGTCYCSFDFKAVFADGDVSEKRGVNVCEIQNFRFYE